MQVGMLGPLEVRSGSGELVPVAGARLRALLIALALHPSRMVSSDRLVEALWDEQAPAGAGNALQALVSRLRRALPEATVLARPAGYQLELEPERVDTVRFERLVSAGRAQLRDDPAGAADTLRRALALWRGPALAEVARSDFARATIARLDELRLTAIQDRADADLRLGADASLVAELEGLVAAHPLREPLVARFIRALDAAGRRAEALEAYEQTRRRILDQLGVRPSAELAAVHLAMLRAESGTGRAPAGPAKPTAGAVAAARTVAAVGTAARSAGTGAPDGAVEPAPTNLRAELTSLIGRDEDLAQVAKLLGAGRLTTLTGPGGAGKTRLATAAARAQLDTMPDGVWLVELAPVTDPADVAPTVLDALRLRQAALHRGRRTVVEDVTDPGDRLVAALADKRTLLVLDNCEHLIESAAALADRVLAACPRVTILATSREPLGIGGEIIWPVQSLALPPEVADPVVVAGYASVRLLVHRAGAVRPHFEVNAGNALAIARICRALDGMPLAIELAAARLRAMTPEQLATRLDDRFRLLTGGSRTALARHQTLAAVVGWSWDLLDDAERALWRRLSVFAGGATLEAVERVCADDLVEAGRVLDLLAALVDKSLLAMRDDNGQPRYQQLEIIKAYGQERLAEAGERDAVRMAHAAHFLELAEAAQDHLLAREQVEWLARLRADHDNLHAAIRNALAAGDLPAAVRLVAALGLYWWLGGHKIEGAELADEVLTRAGAPGEEPGRQPDEPLAVAYAMGSLLCVDSRYEPEQAVVWFRAATRLARRIPEPEHPMTRMIGPLGVIYEVAMGGGPVSTEALAAAAHDRHPWLAATARIVRAHVELNYGRRHAEAETDFLEALRGYRSLGERWGTAFALASLATVKLGRGEYPAAVEYLQEAVTAAGELGGAEDEAGFRYQLARALWLVGERSRAREVLAVARRQADRFGLPEIRAQIRHTAGDLARLDGDLSLARTELLAALELVHQHRVAPQLRAVVTAALAQVAIADRDPATARAHYAEAVAAAAAAIDAPVIAQVLGVGADLALRAGDPSTAATLLGAATAIRGAPDLSLVDDVRTTEAARAALGDAGFDEAYRAGQAATIETWRELPGVEGGGTATPR